MICYRACKVRYDPWDGTGAALQGGRWNSPGRAVIYAADSFAGSILEILAHALRPRTLPGPHHASRFDIDETLIEVVSADGVPGWQEPSSTPARSFGDRWLDELRSAALVVPALPSRPVGRLVLINPVHPGSAGIARGAPFTIPWDERLF